MKNMTVASPISKFRLVTCQCDVYPNMDFELITGHFAKILLKWVYLQDLLIMVLSGPGAQAIGHVVPSRPGSTSMSLLLSTSVYSVGMIERRKTRPTAKRPCLKTVWRKKVAQSSIIVQAGD